MRREINKSRFVLVAAALSVAVWALGMRLESSIPDRLSTFISLAGITGTLAAIFGARWVRGSGLGMLLLAVTANFLVFAAVWWVIASCYLGVRGHFVKQGRSTDQPDRAAPL